MRLLPLLSVLAALLGAARAGDVPVSVGGSDRGSVYVYTVGERRFLDARQAIAAYGGRFTWHPVAGRVQLSVRGRQALLLVGSTKARVGDESFELPDAVIVRTDRVFVPLEFFASPAFSRATATDARFDAAAGRLVLEPRRTVGPLRWFTHKDHTRIVLELAPGLRGALSRRGRSTLEVTIPFGAIAGAEEAEIHDGAVERVRLRQDSRVARLTLELAEAKKTPAWRVDSLDDPARLVLDVYPDPAALASARRGGAAAPSAADGGDAPAASGVAVPVIAASSGAAAAAPAIRAKRRIVIDPGHGGKDSGAIGRRGTQEKDVNLKVAKDLARRLRESGTFEVLLTRDEDVFVPLAERSRMANDFAADLFVSIHCNASSRRSENGFEIYFLSERASDPDAQRVAEMENASLKLEDPSRAPADAETALLLHAMAKNELINDAAVLAGLMSKRFARGVALPDRGVKQAAFYVLRGTNAAAVLVELAFVSNPSEESKLGSKGFRRKAVDGLYAGILDFTRRHDAPLTAKP